MDDDAEHVAVRMRASPWRGDLAGGYHGGVDVNPYEAPRVAVAAVPIEATPQGRPVGVWIATIWAGLFAGVLPLLFEIYLFFGPAEVQEIMSRTTLLLSIALAVGIIASAIGTFLGHSASRYLLMVLVAVHYSLLAYNNLAMLNAGVEVRGSAAKLIGRIVRSIITAGIIDGYLTLNRRACVFFTQR